MSFETICHNVSDVLFALGECGFNHLAVGMPVYATRTILLPPNKDAHTEDWMQIGLQFWIQISRKRKETILICMYY